MDLFLPFFAFDVHALRWMGGALAAVCFGLAIWPVAELNARKTPLMPHHDPVHLVTTGPFAISRHPIYLAMALLVLATGLIRQTWGGVVLAPIFALIIDRRFIRDEERRLLYGFPSAQLYFQTTRRWI